MPVPMQPTVEICACKKLVTPDALPIIARRFGRSTLELIECCSTSCVLKWVAKARPQDWASVQLPKLDEWDLRIMQKALKLPTRIKRAA